MSDAHVAGAQPGIAKSTNRRLLAEICTDAPSERIQLSVRLECIGGATVVSLLDLGDVGGVPLAPPQGAGSL
jgi:hypothetical protein